MTTETKALPKKKKLKSNDSDDRENGGGAADAKTSSVKKKKKIIGDKATANPSTNLGTTKKSSVSTKKTSIQKKPASAKSVEEDAPAPSVSLLEREEPEKPSSRRIMRPASSREGLRAPSETFNGRTNAGRSSHALTNGGRGRGRGRGAPGRGRGAPSSRGVGRYASYDGPRPGSTGPSNISAPKRPQSMRAMPGVPHDPIPRRPESMMGLMGASGRGNFGKSIKVMGRNAVSNRKLPPPPGARSKSKRNLLGSSHHKSSRSFYSDEEEEFASELADDSLLDKTDLRKPDSILRRSARPTAKRMNADGSISLSTHSANFSIDEDEEFQEIQPIINRLPSQSRPTLANKKPGLGIQESEHSMRGWTQSFKWNSGEKNGDRKSRMSDLGAASRSVRSLLTVDMEFEDEPLWKQTLRYLRIMAPHPDEKPLKKSIRIFTWLALVLDFMTGVVSIINFDDVTYCCDDPILSIAGNINWHIAIQTVIYLYMVMIFAEIIPVMREGFPFNLLNPFIGFLITFAMFFDDRITEAVIMWIIEASAVLCEAWVYRLKLKWHNQRQERLNKTEIDLVSLRKERKRRRMTGSTHSLDSASSDLSFDDKSFHDESAGGSSEDLSRPKDISQIRETRLLRERRLLRQAQSEDTKTLRYHFMGTAFNLGCVVISMLLIIMVGRSGGLCIVDMAAPNIFKSGQLDRCYECQGKEGECQECERDENGVVVASHCYYPYY